MTGAVCEGMGALLELDPNLHFIKKYAPGGQCRNYFLGQAPDRCTFAVQEEVGHYGPRICLAENIQAGM